MTTLTSSNNLVVVLSVLSYTEPWFLLVLPQIDLSRAALISIVVSWVD